MANNIDVTPGTGKTVAAEEVSAVIYQLVKLVDATAASVAPTGVAANPLQVSIANTGLNGTPIAVASHAVTNAGTFAVQATIAAGAAAIAKAEDVAAAGGDVGVPAMAIQLATPADTAADGDYAMLQMSAGRVWVDASGKTLTVASHAVTNAGTFATQVDGAALTSLQLIDDTVFVDDAAFTPGTSKILGVGFEADEGSTDSVDEGDIGAGRMTLDRKQIVTSMPHTNGGCLIANMTSGDSFTALTNSAQAIKASAGQLYGWYIYNPNAAATYVIIYNTAAASVTVGTTNPVMVLCIPPTSAANILSAVGIEFTNAGFSAAATTTGGGNSAPASALEANFFYK